LDHNGLRLWTTMDYGIDHGIDHDGPRLWTTMDHSYEP